MATTAVEPIFIDTNVLVYSTLASAPLHLQARQTLADLLSNQTPIWISRQILREYLSTVTRPQSFSPPLSTVNAVADAQHFLGRFQVADENTAVTTELLQLLSTVPCAGKQVHDANIVATMLAHGLSRQLTHNVADFQRFGARITIVPLVP